MRDELNKNRKSTRKECLTLNIDHSSNDGTHWTCLFVKNSACYYFGSLEVIEYCKSNDRYYNNFQIQRKNEVICGHYFIYMLHSLSNGSDLYGVLDELYRYNLK